VSSRLKNFASTNTTIEQERSKMSVDLLDRSAVTGLTAAVSEFVKAGAPPALLPIFLLVARNPNRTGAELARLERVSGATMSRHLLTLGHSSLALIQTRAEAGGTRDIRHSLSDKGTALLQRMTTRR
jgi:DNA-binding MarR family transcriptional regulator